MSRISKPLVEECRVKLLDTKEQLLNRVKDIRKNLYLNDEKGGDEADQTVRVLAESEVLGQHDRIRKQLYEIEQALSLIHI